MSIKNISKNLSPKARIVLILTGLVTAGMIWLMVSLFSKDEPNLPPAIKGTVEINNDNTTEKERGDKKKLLPDDSVVQQQIEELQNIEKEEKKKKGSFIDQLELSNDTKVLNEIENKLNDKPVTTGVDDVVDDKLKQRQQRAQDLLEKKRRAENANNERNGAGSRRNAAEVYVQTTFDEEKFLNEELTSASSKGEAVATYASTLSKITVGSVAAGGVSSGAENMSEEQNPKGFKIGDTTTRRKSANGGVTNYNDFIRDPSEFPKADLADLDRMRGLARQQMGNNSLDGQGGDSQLSQENYESVVYPTSMPNFENAEKILPGDLFYAVLEIEVNTDEISPVRATIVQEGPLKGGVLIGMPKRVGAKSIIEFNSLSLNGQNYSGLNVVAVDPNTMRSVLADDVDFHTFERYFKLAAASIVAGYAQTLQEVEDNENANGSTSQTVRGPEDFNDRVAVALGRVGEKLEPKFEQAFDRQPTVRIYRNRDLGIMFMSELIINGTN